MLLPPEKTIASLIKKGGGTLQQLVDQALHLKALNEGLRQHLDSEIAKQCKVINLEQGCLTIAATNGNYATLLRYQTGELLSALRKIKGFHGLASIKVQVAPISKPLVKKEDPPVSRKLTPEEAQTLLATAVTLDNEEIKKALAQLAENTGD